MQAIGAPNYVYQAVMELVHDAVSAKISFTHTFNHCDGAIHHFAQWFQLESLYLRTITKRLQGQSYPCIVHNAEAMYTSILYSAAMNEDNMLFPNPDNPLAPPPDDVTVLNDVDTGRLYHKAYTKLCHKPNEIKCPVIAYFDKLTVDLHGHISLKPFYVTLGLLKWSSCNQPGSWRPLDYMPNLYLLSTH